MKMKIFRKFLMMTILASVFTCGSVQAATQEVALSPAVISASPGQAIQLDLNYHVPDGKKQTTGLGVRIHYNSKAIGDLRLQDLYAEGLIAQDESAQNDLKDLDNDPSTDKYLGIAWIGIQGEWPSMQDVPLKLGNISLTVLKESGIETHLNISYSSKPVGYNFRGQGMSIKIK